MSIYVLGLNAFHADAAAVLLKDGRMVAAAEEERFNRVKHSAGFPEQAVRFCLAAADIDLGRLDHVALASKPIQHVQEEILLILAGRPAYSRHIRRRLEEVARIRDVRALLAAATGRGPDALRAQVHEHEHHLCHMASAWLQAGGGEVALASVDGFGDFCSLMLGRAGPAGIEVIDKVLFPHSLGILYTCFTQFLGFKKYGDEGKVMGLAAYGQPRHAPQVRQLVALGDEPLLRLAPDYFIHPVHGVDMMWEDRVPHAEDLFSDRFIEVFGPPRGRYTPIEQRHRDLAASVQLVLEEALLHIMTALHRRTGLACAGYAGGVALNTVANRRLIAAGPFRELHIPAAPGDAGTALGAAALTQLAVTGQPAATPGIPLWGPRYEDRLLEAALREAGLSYRRYQDREDKARRLAELLDGGAVVGYFQGAMEFGPRALGARSILADPRKAEQKQVLNTRIKYREDFRPFACTVQLERQAEFFQDPRPSPHMQFIFQARPEAAARIGAVVHVDGSTRVQTVDRETWPEYWSILEAFRQRTGIPLLLNTSFNENEPIVCTPQEAIACFLTTRMDALSLGGFLVTRTP